MLCRCKKPKDTFCVIITIWQHNINSAEDWCNGALYFLVMLGVENVMFLKFYVVLWLKVAGAALKYTFLMIWYSVFLYNIFEDIVWTIKSTDHIHNYWSGWWTPALKDTFLRSLTNHVIGQHYTKASHCHCGKQNVSLRISHSHLNTTESLLFSLMIHE